MFDHKNFALNGLFPGLVTTRSVANLGSYEIEIIIVPPVTPPSSGGGGYFYPVKPNSNKYTIRIRVTRNGKVWEYEQLVSPFTAKVIAKLTSAKTALPDVTVNNISVVEPEQVKVTIK